MTCGTCGATIADKAIVCYRCGAPTVAPAAKLTRPTAPRRPRAGALALLVVGVVLAVMGFMLPADTGSAPEILRVSGLVVSAVAGARVLARRR